MESLSAEARAHGERLRADEGCRELLADAQQRLAEARAALAAAVAAEAALAEERRELQRALDEGELERGRAVRQRDDALLKLELCQRQRDSLLAGPAVGAQGLLLGDAGGMFTPGRRGGVGMLGRALLSPGAGGMGMSDVDAAAMTRLQTLLRVQ